MRSIEYPLDCLLNAFGLQRVLTLPEMMAALGTRAKMTVFRKLREVNYRASYSHAGKYYTLDESAGWDAEGLWAYQGRDVIVYVAASDRHRHVRMLRR